MFRLFFHRFRFRRSPESTNISLRRARDTVPMERIDQVRALVRDMEAKAQQIRHAATRPPENEQRVADA